MSRNVAALIHRSLTDTAPHQASISGATPSIAALLLFQELLNSPALVSVVAASPEDAATLHGDFVSIARAAGQNDWASRALLIPGWERVPYGGFVPSLTDRFARMSALARIPALKDHGIVFTDVRAWSQRCPSPSWIAAHCLTLKTGMFVDPQSLEERLLTLGYRRADPVEDPGSFSRRGFILDVFPYGGPACRAEFYGDELEQLRTFDPRSQRTAKDFDGSLLIPPCQEWDPQLSHVTFWAARIKEHCDNVGIPKKSRDALVQRLESGLRDPSDDYLWPFFNDQISSIHDHCPNFRTVLFEPLSLEGELTALEEDVSSGAASAIKENVILPPAEHIYVPHSTAATWMKQASLRLSTLEVPRAASNLDNTQRLDCLPGTMAAPGKPPGSEEFVRFAHEWLEQGNILIVFCSSQSQADRVRYLCESHDISLAAVNVLNFSLKGRAQVITGSLSSGFRLVKDGTALLTDQEVFGLRRRIRAAIVDEGPTPESLGELVSSVEDLDTGDLVVHKLHGIGRYLGLTDLKIESANQEFLLLEYAGGDKLYLPIYRLDQMHRYAASGSDAPLDKLGSGRFERAKAVVRAALKDVAHGLLKLYAQRASQEGFRFSAADDSYREFEGRFPHAETPDQLRAIRDTGKDMEQGKIMDRLICGDVGYGKTEVAMRAAFRAVQDGKQVAVLVPTTVLCFQHERSFRDRMKDYPITIAGLSRFKTKQEIEESLRQLKDGKVDIVIGTHRLLSRDVVFKDLGLLIIDEEHRFGVSHKERLKTLKASTSCLTLTATPIPRTLQMALFGLRDISVIATAPTSRLAVKTYVSRFSESVIQEVLRAELTRGGQAFFVHNRVQSLFERAELLQRLVPEARVLVAHGQMAEGELEKRMEDFYSQKYDVLLCTTIIESGLDIPTANTMIIDDAHEMGLAQLYQLRGRVGRGRERAFCYMLIPETGKLREDAQRRLDAIQRFADLGSGFKVASTDLDIRGGGDVLGTAQSGHVAEIGIEMYTELLQEAVMELRGAAVQRSQDPEIKLPEGALLPDDYVADLHQRLHFYRSLSSAANEGVLQGIEAELSDRYGPLPHEAATLMWLIRIKQLLVKYRIKTLVAGMVKTSLEVDKDTRISITKTLAAAKESGGLITLTPDSRLLIQHQYVDARVLCLKLESLLASIAEG